MEQEWAGYSFDYPLVTFFIWPRGASENMFEVKNLTHLKVGEYCKKLVIVELSAKHKLN